MKILTAAEMREVDRRTVAEYGISGMQLMDNAAAGLLHAICENVAFVRDAGTVVLCGKGNNGGDGLAFARMWADETGVRPQVIVLAAPAALQGDGAANLKRWQEAGGSVTFVASTAEWEAARTALGRAQLIVDALLGTGANGPAEGLIARAIVDINLARSHARIVSVDTPSGLPPDGAAPGGSVVQAHLTVTFTAPKVGLVADGNAEMVGSLAVRAIGSPPQLVEQCSGSRWRWLDAAEFAPLPLTRKADAHKGDFGHALLIAGSRGKTGAAALAGWGALRSGAGLVTVATPQDELPVVASHSPEYMTEPLATSDAGSVSLRALEYGRLSSLQAGKDCVALGPGLSLHPETQEFARTVVRESPLPLILDADGLNAFAGRAAELRARESPFLAVTPHPGEMARLSGRTVAGVQAHRNEIALAYAAQWNACVVLKGHRTVLATPDGQLFVNSTGTPWMATGGTGDVLTGMLAGLTAHLKTADWGRVLALGVWLHGLAGYVAAQGGRQPIVASDLVAAIPQAYATLLAQLRDDHSFGLQ
jgi:NAD(P)H-hydrate epimerase